jgi:hypothetical protein
VRSARRVGGLILTVASCACRSSPLTRLIDGGGSGSGSTGAIVTTGVSGGTSATSSGSSTGGTSGGSATTTGGGSTTGGTSGGASTTSGPQPLPQPCVWVGDVCAVGNCANVSLGATCALDGGGLGNCYSGTCQRIDLKNDPNNCGSYGVVCPTDAGCVGSCQGLDCTDGGGCGPGRFCQPYYGCVVDDCSQAQNDVTCLADTGWSFCCNNKCIDEMQYPAADPFTVDPFNCGGCGIRCPQGFVCWAGVCALSEECAVDDFSLCSLPSEHPGQCCAGGCTDILNDPLNCGACGFGCPTGSACQLTDAGACTASCMTNNDCRPGYTCPPGLGGQCLLGSSCGPDMGTTCFNPDSGWATCCHGQCVSYSIYEQNCGGCGSACTTGEKCALVGCVLDAPCKANDDACVLDGGAFGTCCAGQCSDLDSDPSNCGSCDLSCPIGALCPLRYNCVDGSGTPTGCSTDADCPSGDRCTENGFCVPATCDGGRSVCFLLPDSGAPWGDCCDGVCTNTLVDSKNCSFCGAECPDGLACVNGGCAAPDGGYVWDCSSPCPSQSYCYRGSGECSSAACAGRQADGTACFYGAKPFDPISGGEGYCCGDTCIDPFSDPINCGGCGIACPSGQCWYGNCYVPPGQNCTMSCGSGTICAGIECVDSMCPSSYYGAYCLAEDGAVGTCCSPGCAHLDRDPQNCGACGIACPPGMTCQSGLCGGLAACGPGVAGSFCNLDAGLSYLCCPGQGCIDTAGDTSNCGACAAACATGQTCVAGTCT